jgi:hypothetical protein
MKKVKVKRTFVKGTIFCLEIVFVFVRLVDRFEDMFIASQVRIGISWRVFRQNIRDVRVIVKL